MREIDALPDRVAAPEPEDLDVDRLVRSLPMSKHEVGDTHADPGVVEEDGRDLDLPGRAICSKGLEPFEQRADLVGEVRTGLGRRGAGVLFFRRKSKQQRLAILAPADVRHERPRIEHP